MVSAGDLVRASDEPKVIRKAATEGITSSTTLQDDDELFFSVDAGGNYLFEFNLIYAGDATGDFKAAFTFPTGTLSTHFIGMATTGALNVGDGKFVGASETTSPSTARNFGASGSDVTLRIKGLFQATAAGTFKLQWAQDVSSATTLNVKAGSLLEYQKVA